MPVAAVSPTDTRTSYIPSSRYSWQIFKNGTLFADLTGLCQKRMFVITRDDSDMISCSISLDKLIWYANALNTDVQNIIQSWVSELRVSRLGTVLTAGELQPWDTNVGGDRLVNLTFLGWMELFKLRRTSNSYTSQTAQYILQAEVAATLARTYGSAGNFNGLTIGAVPSPDLSNVYPTQNYDQKTLFDAFQDMTTENNGFDYEVTWDKKINMYYPSQGQVRPDILFTYPNGNVKDIQYSVDTTHSFNYLTARGKGNGESQITTVVSDAASMNAYGIREDCKDYSNITDSTQLSNLASSDLTLYKQPIVLHKIIFDGSGRTSAPQIGTFHIGDQVQISVTNFRLYSDINQYFRIDKITVEIDDNDMETVTLDVSIPS